ncbi:biogenesis of lysosome-related organelles complex 1 subunit 4 [Sitodiplosis mosellana]|uniref:biogenesis of lysosome-related organelles complex 1 subunit 4 n=1 Tax=Sitodiplosis mosellana TaxID=263140 RepID=UPI002444CD7C|nr:biogenesis of lysosome-related organelles complex 1 subunit 4 [Sitodiplosis mosellana]
MVEETARDYANYLRQIDFAKEIAPICTNIDEILTRMDELESSISIMKNISASTSLPNIIECKTGIQQYSDRIDKLQLMLDRVNIDITSLEQNMNKAEEELGYNNTGIKGFFKPLLGKIVKSDRSRLPENVDDPELTYKPIEFFKASQYFGESSSSLSDSLSAEGAGMGDS